MNRSPRDRWQSSYPLHFPPITCHVMRLCKFFARLIILLARTYAPPRKEESNAKVCSLVISPHSPTKCVNNQYAFILVRCGEIAEARCLGFPSAPPSSPQLPRQEEA